MFFLSKIRRLYNEYFVQKLAVDFGSHSVKISCPIRGVLVDEPSVVIVNGSDIIAIGAEADMIKTKIPHYYRVIYPVKNGLIYDFDAAEVMMEYFFKKAYMGHKNKLFKPSAKVLVAHGTNTTPIQEKNLKELFLKIGAYDVGFISQTIAAAIGAGVPIHRKECFFLFNIGSGVSEFVIVADSNIVESKVVTNGGIDLTKSIMDSIFQKEKLQISYRTAEALKITHGNLTGENNNESFFVVGQDKFMNIPKEVELKVKQINQPLIYSFKYIFEEFMKIVDKINPDIAEDIYHNGIYIFGGSSELKGLDGYISQLLNIKVHKYPQARMLPIKGCLKIMEGK